MTRVRINGVVWVTGPRGATPRARAVAVAGRALMVAAAMTGIGVGLAGMGSPVSAARGGPTAPVALKDEARLGQPARARSAVPAGPFAAELLGAPTAFAPADLAEAPRLAGPFEAPVPGGWHEGEFTGVAVADGRTLIAGALRIRLEGLDLPGADEACRTVDGRREPCRQRAATVLELTTRWRAVSCRYRYETATQAVGACRLGTSDLAERMARTGLLRRTGETPRVLASAGTPTPN